MKCEKCGSEMKLQEGIVYISNPVQYGYKCPNCGNVQYSMIKEENNQIDYEKKYKEAIERMKSWVRGEHPECFSEAQKAAEFVFPELAESEDERIRKSIICGMNALKANQKKKTFAAIPIDDCIAWLEKQKEPEDKGDISDGYHTFNELYRYRMLYNAAFFSMLPKEWVHKSKKHHDGEDCFGGGWFIVMANLPTGQISNHYELKDWDLFQIPEKEVSDKWDGHTPQEAADRLHKYLLEKQGEKDQIELSDEDKENFEWFDRLFRAESVVLGRREIPQEKYYWFKSLRPPIIKTSMKDNNADCVINTLTDGADKPEVKLTEKMQTRLEDMAREYIHPNWLKDFGARDVMEAFKEGYKAAMFEIYGPSSTITNYDKS